MAPRRGGSDEDELLRGFFLKIVRAVANGHHRFEEIQLATGISRYILADRLVFLVADGDLEKHQYNAMPKRYEYHLSQKGKELNDIADSFSEWMRKWNPDDPDDDGGAGVPAIVR